MFFAFSDQAECKSTIHWLCDYVSYQANKKATHHSRDLNDSCCIQLPANMDNVTPMAIGQSGLYNPFTRNASVPNGKHKRNSNLI